MSILNIGSTVALSLTLGFASVSPAFETAENASPDSNVVTQIDESFDLTRLLQEQQCESKLGDPTSTCRVQDSDSNAEQSKLKTSLLKTHQKGHAKTFVVCCPRFHYGPQVQYQAPAPMRPQYAARPAVQPARPAAPPARPVYVQRPVAPPAIYAPPAYAPPAYAPPAYAQPVVYAAPAPLAYAQTPYNPSAAYPAAAQAPAPIPLQIQVIAPPQVAAAPAQAQIPVNYISAPAAQVAVAPPAPPAAPLAPPAPPVPAAPVGDVVLSNLEDAPIVYTVDGKGYDMKPGFTQKLVNRSSWTIAFDRGDGSSVARYTLTQGAYRFGLTEKGWELFKQDDAPAQPTPIPGFQNVARNR
jgi:hypothetical protein